MLRTKCTARAGTRSSTPAARPPRASQTAPGPPCLQRPSAHCEALGARAAAQLHSRGGTHALASGARFMRYLPVPILMIKAGDYRTGGFSIEKSNKGHSPDPPTLVVK